MANPDMPRLPPRNRRPQIDYIMPFRRFYIGFRSLILAFEIAALGYLISLAVHYRGREYVLPLIAVGSCLFLPVELGDWN